MKKEKKWPSVLFGVVLACFVVLSSCKDSDESQNSPIVYGEFVVTNLTTGEIIEGDDATVVPGDSLNIKFVPHENYKHLIFNIQNKYEGNLTGNTFLIHPTTISVTTEAEGVTIKPYNRLELTASTTSVNDKLEVNRSIKLYFYEKSSLITCYVGIQADLLELVEPVISFSDNKGNHIECHPFEEKEIVRNQEEIDLSDNLWYKSFRYVQWGNEAEARLSFIRKSTIELTRDSYDLGCFFDLGGDVFENGKGSLNMSMGVGVNVTIGGSVSEMEDKDGKIKREFVEQFISKLVEKTEYRKICIDENGKVTDIIDK